MPIDYTACTELSAHQLAELLDSGLKGGLRIIAKFTVHGLHAPVPASPSFDHSQRIESTNTTCGDKRTTATMLAQLHCAC